MSASRRTPSTPHLWIVPVAGGEAKRLTPATGPGEDRFRFSPDGKRVIFESRPRRRHADLGAEFRHRCRCANGRTRESHHISTEASGGTWSPDGKSILFVSSVYPDCKDDACNKQRDDEQAKSKVKAMIFDHLMFRHWTHYDNGKRSHLFMVPIEGGSRATSRPAITMCRRSVSEVRTSTLSRPTGKRSPTPATGRSSSHQHQQRCVCRARCRRAAERNHHQSRQRWHADVFSRWQVHRLSLAATRRLRERPLPPDAVRARDRQDHRPHAELRSLG